MARLCLGKSNHRKENSVFKAKDMGRNFNREEKQMAELI